MHTPEQILIKVDCKVESSAEEPNPPGLISAQTYISAVELVGMILDEVESWDFHGGDGRERSSSSASISLPPPLSFSLLKRVADVPAHPLERMTKHSSILGVGIIITISRKYAHVPSRGRSGNGLQNLLETELQHILLQEQQVSGFKDSFLGNSVQTRTSTSMSNYFPDRDPQRRVSQLQMNSKG